MKTMKVTFCFFVFILLTNTFILVKAKDKNKMKNFACKVITLNGKMYQTLLLGTDWKELIPKNDLSIKTENINSNFKIDIKAWIVNGELKIKIFSNRNQKITFTLVNILGSSLKKWNFDINDKISYCTKNISGIIKGIYLLNAYNQKILITTIKVSYL